MSFLKINTIEIPLTGKFFVGFVAAVRVGLAATVVVALGAGVVVSDPAVSGSVSTYATSVSSPSSALVETVSIAIKLAI